MNKDVYKTKGDKEKQYKLKEDKSEIGALVL